MGHSAPRNESVYVTSSEDLPAFVQALESHLVLNRSSAGLPIRSGSCTGNGYLADTQGAVASGFSMGDRSILQTNAACTRLNKTGLYSALVAWSPDV